MRTDAAASIFWWITCSAQVAAAMGLASPQIAGSVGGLLPVRYGFADERDPPAGAERKPRRSAARIGGVRLPDRRGARRLLWPPFFPRLIEVAESATSVDAYDDLTEDELLQQLSERLS